MIKKFLVPVLILFFALQTNPILGQDNSDSTTKDSISITDDYIMQKVSRFGIPGDGLPEN